MVTNDTRQAGSKIAIVIANSEINIDQLKAALDKFRACDPVIYAADGGAEVLRGHDLLPHLIVGDFDSTSPETLEYFRSRGTVIKHALDQGRCDLDKCLELVSEHQILLFGALAGRLDHTVSNLSIIARYHDRHDTVVIGNQDAMILARGSVRLELPQGSRISIIPMPEITFASTDGLEFNFANKPLKLFPDPPSVCAETASDASGLTMSLSNRVSSADHTQYSSAVRVVSLVPDKASINATYAIACDHDLWPALVARGKHGA